MPLIDLNIVQIVNRKLNGEVKICCFPRTLREVLSEGRRNSEIVRSWSLYTSSNRQLAYIFDDKDTSYNGGIHGLDSDIVSQHDGYPISIMVFDSREGPDPGEDIGKFLLNGIRSGRFLDLVVLDLKGIFRPHLPSTIGRLKRLKFLGLRWTYLEILPSSICKLLHLQTLDLKYTNLFTLPFSIWKLMKLQHLHLNRNCRIKFMPQPNAISMENLQVLSGVFVDHEGIALTNRLHKLSNLRRLELTFQLTKPQQEVLATCIRQLTHLNSLRLRSLSETAVPQDLILDNCLKELTKLSRLHLMGKLELESLIELPESLSELRLSASRLSGSVNSLLGKLSTLPKLESLSFFGDSYCEPEMVFPKGFSKLLVLKIWKLDNLRKLVVEEEAMQKLREFEIRSCGVLEHTIGLTHLKTLQELKLTNMPAAHAAAIEKEFTAAYKEQYADNVSLRLIKINNGQFSAQFS
ncbi:LRR domain containing protein [Trema orientale]|uniref:LRR domain containing protein n=1 Tax=Trema orientale TaxID=63057 RepID=A0A2P5ETQ8_TREOI|nr:LRR domain containing protein [Trema orientale]